MNKKQITIAVILGLVAVFLAVEITRCVDKIYFDKSFRNTMELLDRDVKQATYYGDSLSKLVNTELDKIDRETRLTRMKEMGYRLSTVLESANKEYDEALEMWKRYGTLEDKDKLDRYGFSLRWYGNLLRESNRFYYGK